MNSSPGQNEHGKLALPLKKLMGVEHFVLIRQSRGYEMVLGKFYCDFRSYWRKMFPIFIGKAHICL